MIHFDFISSLTITFLCYFFIEGFIKPAIANHGRKKILYIAPKILYKLDFVLPDFLKNKSETEIRAWIEKEILGIDKTVSNKEIEAIIKKVEKEYSFLINARKIDATKT